MPAAAIASLARSDIRKASSTGRVALGPDGPALHAEAGRQARAAGLKRVWTLGALAAETSRAFGDGGREFDSRESLVAALREALADAVEVRCLVKGSRGSAMDVVVAGVLAGEGADAA